MKISNILKLVPIFLIACFMISSISAIVANDDKYSSDSTGIEINFPGYLSNDMGINITDDFWANLVSNTFHGELNFTQYGKFSYMPASGFSGVDYFTYNISNNVSDVVTDSNTAYVIIDVNNTAPIAVADEYVCDEKGSVITNFTNGILANDTNLENDSLIIIVTRNVLNGTLVLLDDGSFNYTANAGFRGIDYFNYQLSDRDKISTIVRVTLNASLNSVVKEEVIVPSSGGSSGGSGSGGNCITKWNCSEWSLCNNGTQTRNCSYPTNYCKPTELKPSQTQTCTNDNGNTNSTETDNTQSNLTNFVSGITGAVVGALSTGTFWIVAGLIVLLIAGFFFIRYRRIHSSKKE